MQEFPVELPVRDWRDIAEDAEMIQDKELSEKIAAATEGRTAGESITITLDEEEYTFVADYL